MDVWQIGVRISLANGMSPVLAIIAKDLLGLKGSVGEVEKAFGGWKTAIAGAAAVLAGGALIGGVMKLADHGKVLLDQQDKLQRSGMAYNDVLRIQKDYFDNVSKAIPTASADEYLKTINEMQSVVGLNMAQQTAPFALKLDAIIANALGKDVSGSGFSLWRALEMRGTTLSDPEGTSRLANAFAQDIIGSGGKLTADTFQTMGKRGGVSWINASPEFLAGPGAVVAADLGGDTAGTALMSLYQMLSGATTLSKQQYGVLLGANLIDPNKVTEDKGGRINVEPGGIVGSDIGMKNPYEWVQKVVKPALDKMSGGDEMVFDSLLAKIGRNRNTTRMLTMFSDPGFNEQIMKDTQLWQRASPVDKAYDDAMARNPMMIDKGFQEQWKSMMEALGGPLAQAAIPVMKSLTSMFQSAGAIANAHPEMIKLVGEALVGLGAGLVAIGTVAVVGAAIMLAPGGLITVAIAGIGAAVTSIVAMNWSKIPELLNGFVNAIGSFIDKMGGLLQQLLGLIGLGVGTGAIPRPKDGAPAPMWSAPSGGGRGLLHPTNYPMNGGGPPPVIHTAINIDGRRLATAVSTHMARNGSWSGSSSTFDGQAMPAPTDVSYI